MIRVITVTNYRGESLKMELAKPQLSGLAITSIDGLGPGKADLAISEHSIIDGGAYSSGRIPTRNIVINLKYLPGMTIEESRLRTYKYFPLKKYISMVIETDSRFAVIYGYVESNEPDIFSDSSGSVISIMCPDPYFYSLSNGGGNTNKFTDVKDVFEFPFVNDSVTQNLLVISEIISKNMKTIKYYGDCEIGLNILIEAVGDAKNFLFRNQATGESLIINSEMKSGDKIMVCTERGKKSITKYSGTTTTNIINTLRVDSDWIRLIHGDNLITYIAESGTENINVAISNRVIYEGM